MTSATTRRAISSTARMLNALCYLLSGTFMLVVEITKASTGGVALTLLALAMLAYGLYVALTRRSYWVSTLTYIIPLIGISFAIAAISH